MRINKAWFPNAISLSRPVFGSFLPYYTAAGDWNSAFFLAVVLIFTDALDGWAALAVGVKSQFGKDWIDPLCDFGLAVWGLVAWSAQSPHEAWRVWISIAIIGITITGKILKWQKRHKRVHHFVYGALPLFYLACAWIYLRIFCIMAFPDHVGTINAIAAVSAVGFAILKWYRLEEWFGHIRMSLAKNPASD